MFFESPQIDIVFRALALSTAGLLWIIGLVRLIGLRSFSKMTSFDFVMTISMGSLLASAAQAEQWASFSQTMLSMATLFTLQYLLSRFRLNSRPVSRMISNEPVLLMRNGKILEETLKSTRVSRTDLIAKLREANVTSLETVGAAVLETTGDVSVIHGEAFDERLLEGVNLRRLKC